MLISNDPPKIYDVPRQRIESFIESLNTEDSDGWKYKMIEIENGFMIEVYDENNELLGKL